MQTEMMMTDNPEQAPIFIFGILQRSGTNFLNNLLLLHPHMVAPGIVWEDYLLAPLDSLDDYVEGVMRRWDPAWRVEIDNNLGSDALLRHMGKGLLGFMSAQYQTKGHLLYPVDKQDPRKLRFVTATPRVNRIDGFFKLFSNALGVIIVRDGRAVVESGVRSFGWDYEEAMRNWAEGAKGILALDAMPSAKGRYLVTRYEDLHMHTAEELRRILDFAQLDAAMMDFDAAANIGIMGSSELKRAGDDLHWKYVEKPQAFNPMARSQNWQRRLHERFNWIAGQQMQQLGYDSIAASGGNFYWQLWNRFLDVMFSLETKTKAKLPWFAQAAKWARQKMLGSSRVPARNEP